MTLTEAFRAQATACNDMGSPFMGQLMSILAEDWPEDSALGRKFAGFEGDVGPGGHSLPLRIAGGLHALVLNRNARDLAALYPPHSVDDDTLRPAVLAALQKHEKFLLEWTDSAPQTNEVRRSAALIAGAHVALRHFNLPIYLSELGASGGLNLHWDHYALEVKGTRFGPDMPVMTLAPEWSGPLPPAAHVSVKSRGGVDLNPLNLDKGEDLLRITAYLWPDQPERLNLTRAAASVSTTALAKGDAIDWLAKRMPGAPQGALHLIQHTVAWQYFPKETQKRGRALIEAAGAQATRNRPLAWLSMETDGNKDGQRGAALTLRLWPGDLRLNLGRVDFHGRWIDWTYS